jgi:hypothetical protein
MYRPINGSTYQSMADQGHWRQTGRRIYPGTLRAEGDLEELSSGAQIYDVLGSLRLEVEPHQFADEAIHDFHMADEF